MKKLLIIISIILFLLLLPLIFKSKSRPGLIGPDLSELEYTEISFKHTSGTFNLAGMLMKPKGGGPFPTAVLIHGSGPSRRNSKWYLSIAKYLQDNGIAVLLPDKRGCEKAEGKWLGASLEELATDTLSAVGFVKNQNIYRYSTIGLIGMSQGGWIAPVAASQSKDISFVVNMSGATVTTDEQLLYEEIHNIAPYTYTFIAKLLARITANNLKKKPFFIPLAGFDPIPFWKKITAPVFIAFGEDDKNVPVELSINRLRENGLNHFKIKTYPKGGHGIVDPNTKKVNPEYLKDLAQFIKSIVPRPLNQEVK